MIRAFLLATRPKTLPAAIVPVWAGTVLAWKLSGSWSLLAAVATLLGAVCIQIATNFFNDAIDAAKGADTERRIGPQRATASGLMSRRAVMVSGGIFLVAATVCGWYLFQVAGWPILAIGVPSLFLAYGYTGGPFPLAYRGMGELFVLVFFGWVAVAGTVFVQLQEWRLESLLLGSQIGLLSCVLISINNLRDREEDASTGKRTLAVRWGPKPARLMIWAEIKLPVILGVLWVFLGQPWLTLAILPVLSIGLRLSWSALTEPEGPGMNRMLALSGLQLVAFAGLFHVLAVIPG
ncbi:1,4-dihydroxy-2-naphthoate octaprenyltransferase [Haloferula rosea]|uniref:1,4-dihydroxy-2-naphthoate octaprenyltransferase n=1 Tax=Haloferula rosea TaxID=490093 RepID=A0A934RCU0_9BACT|nr:1,4-dihydroxy-2-naphthoate octaprenyltransferase [Haloferula rosea]MBK1827232.1 1,4-dihydroxy-2-naphthoate octaprenyltransferase [Haloferula rosea]